MYEKKLEEVAFGVGQLHKASVRAMAEMADTLKAASSADDLLQVVRAAAELQGLRQRVICERLYRNIQVKLGASLQPDETPAQRFGSVYRFVVDAIRSETTSGRSANGEYRLDEESRMLAYGEVLDVFLQVDK
jgi:hypothetical protein